MEATRANVSKKTSFITKVSVLSVIAYVLMFIEVPVIMFPGFLKLDISDVPAILGAFALGPVAGIIIELIKNILHWITRTSTGGVGEFANFVVGCAWIIPAAIIYKMHKSKKYAIVGMIVGTIAMAVIGGIMNYYVMIPFYAKIMPIQVILDMSAAANPLIVDLKTLILYGIVPFNLIKGIIISIVTVLIYKKVSPIIHR